jgi:hypothetical protein
MKEKKSETITLFNIREVDLETRRKLKLYAVQNDLTMAQALKEIVNKGTRKS